MNNGESEPTTTTENSTAQPDQTQVTEEQKVEHQEPAQDQNTQPGIDKSQFDSYI